MSDAAEYRRNARVCAELAAATHSLIDRQIWLRMQLAWLTLATEVDAAGDAVRTAA